MEKSKYIAIENHRSQLAKMEKRRVIMIIPKLTNIEIINDIRNKYDPLSALVKPHVTVVFPFSSGFSNDDIEKWLHAALKDMKPFEMELSGVSKQSDVYGNYLFLNIQKGKSNVEKMNQSLYAGILQEFKVDMNYNPHMTIGKLPTMDLLNAAYLDVGGLDETFNAMVDTISVECIGKDEESIIEIEYKLKILTQNFD